MSAGHGAKIDRRAEAAIAALLTCPTIGEAAKAAGLGEATLRRWMHEPSFAAQYRAAREAVIRSATARLRTLFGDAVTNLGAIMADSAAPFAVRVAASKAVAELALRAHEQEDIRDRLALLEAALDDGGQQP